MDKSTSNHNFSIPLCFYQIARFSVLFRHVELSHIIECRQSNQVYYESAVERRCQTLEEVASAFSLVSLDEGFPNREFPISSALDFSLNYVHWVGNQPTSLASNTATPHSLSEVESAPFFTALLSFIDAHLVFEELIRPEVGCPARYVSKY